MSRTLSAIYQDMLPRWSHLALVCITTGAGRENKIFSCSRRPARGRFAAFCMVGRGDPEGVWEKAVEPVTPANVANPATSTAIRLNVVNIGQLLSVKVKTVVSEFNEDVLVGAVHDVIRRRQ